MKKYLSIYVILALLTSCIGKSEDESQSVQNSHQTLCVKRQDYILKRKLTVKVESQQNIDVRPLIAGRIVKLCVQDGAQVKIKMPQKATVRIVPIDGAADGDNTVYVG